VVKREDWSDAVAAGTQAVLRGHSTMRATLPAELLQQIVGAARAGLPNEAVGWLIADRPASEGGAPSRYIALRNAEQSPYRYSIDDADLLRIIEIEDGGEVVWAIVHSHVASRAEPSATDIGFAALHPDTLFVICSLANPQPETRAWSIRDYAVLEVGLGVT
jgi:proteasome lid subunit RPN8/RPN11